MALYFVQHRNWRNDWTTYQTVIGHKRSKLMFSYLETAENFAKTTSYNTGARVITIDGTLISEFINAVCIYKRK